jgi:hypothetical protein
MEHFFAFSPTLLPMWGRLQGVKSATKEQRSELLTPWSTHYPTEVGKGLLVIRIEIVLERINPKLLLYPYF